MVQDLVAGSGGLGTSTPAARAHVLVLGSGFAGLWSAVGAARRRDELGLTAEDVRITVISRQPFHDIRVRNYEADLSACRIPVGQVLDPVGVHHLTGTVVGIDTAGQVVTVDAGDGSPEAIGCDRLVVALGSELVRPDVPGLADHAFDIDTYDAAARLNRHLARLPEHPDRPGAGTVVVVGAGLTGIEAACEMPGKLAAAFAGRAEPATFRVLLVDHNLHVGSDMGTQARPVIERALAEVGVEPLTGVRVREVTADGIVLDDGSGVPAATVVWCAGMRANPLTATVSPNLDRLGRIRVDDYLRVPGAAGVFAAGDVAVARMDEEHLSVMSCQHGRPMGRFAGYNVISDLAGAPLLRLRIPWYVTVLDLGPAGAVYTEGWDRRLVAQGAQAKRTKQIINTARIYPPLGGDGAQLLAAAAPVVQTPPSRGTGPAH